MCRWFRPTVHRSAVRAAGQVALLAPVSESRPRSVTVQDQARRSPTSLSRVVSGLAAGAFGLVVWAWASGGCLWRWVVNRAPGLAGTFSPGSIQAIRLRPKTTRWFCQFC